MKNAIYFIRKLPIEMFEVAMKFGNNKTFYTKVANLEEAIGVIFEVKKKPKK